MAITNCTVFDSSYSQSYSVIDYPRCPDDLVKANIPSGSDQEKVFRQTDSKSDRTGCRRSAIA